MTVLGRIIRSAEHVESRTPTGREQMAEHSGVGKRTPIRCRKAASAMLQRQSCPPHHSFIQSYSSAHTHEHKEGNMGFSQCFVVCEDVSTRTCKKKPSYNCLSRKPADRQVAGKRLRGSRNRLLHEWGCTPVCLSAFCCSRGVFMCDSFGGVLWVFLCCRSMTVAAVVQGITGEGGK